VLDTISLFCLIGFSLVSLVIAAQLLAIARRTRKLPELLLGLAFVFMLLGNVVIVLTLETGMVADGLQARTIELGEVSLDVGFIAAAAFVVVVFRRGSTWGKTLAWVLCVALVAAQFTSWIMLDEWGRYTALYYIKFGIRGCIYLWTAIEAFAYYRLMTRRVRHGLSEPIVANRFLIWGVASCLGLVMLFGFEVGEVMDYSSPIGASLSLLGSLAGAPAAVLFWLTFRAPSTYRKFVEKYSAVDVIDG
jgi:hypothetical protein